MDRKNAVQIILDKLGGKTYLEIGIAEGRTFFVIKARKKIGVDPNFKIPRKKLMVRLIDNIILHRSERLFKITSDKFFTEKSRILLKNRVDVVLIDGLHTYQQSLRDVVNCLDYLSLKGVIVMHDCNPPSETIGYPAPNIGEARKLNLPGWTGEWCGDVWKTMIYLRSQRRDLHIFTLNCDYGVGVICKGEPENMLNYSVQEIEEMSYQNLKLNRETLLNLKESNYLNEFLNKFNK